MFTNDIVLTEYKVLLIQLGSITGCHTSRPQLYY